MCQNGVNHNQLKLLLEIAGEQCGVTEGWVKEIAHLAGHANLESTDAVERAARLLKEARRLLEDAGDEAGAADTGDGVEVTVV
ncbi:MAG: hypothetical protein LBS17_00390 [Actinomycetes bacterium]|jgi:hypothetical protein|nr:hypothetical protein [Actinomycetes bacterium]